MNDSMRQGWTVKRVTANWYVGKTSIKRKPLAFFATSFSELIEKMAAFEDEPARLAMQEARREEQRSWIRRQNLIKQSQRMAASL